MYIIEYLREGRFPTMFGKRVFHTLWGANKRAKRASGMYHVVTCVKRIA